MTSTPIRLLILLFGLLLAGSALALPKQSLVPGGIAIIPLEADLGKPVFRFRGKPVLITHNQRGQPVALVGLPLSLKPGEYFIEGSYGGQSHRIKKFFTVRNKQYSTQRITIKDKRKVNPYQQDMDRILKEKKRKQKAANSWSDEEPDTNFLLPVEGIITGSYGRRRIFNGQPKRPHSGMDIAADTGVPVQAPADGVVVESGDFFFSGNVIYIHHGEGLVTVYAHLDERAVQPGERVKKGQIIGKVGATGRVTGPHLHWSVGLNGTWVDPALFLDGTDKTASKKP